MWTSERMILYYKKVFFDHLKLITNIAKEERDEVAAENMKKLFEALLILIDKVGKKNFGIPIPDEAFDMLEKDIEIWTNGYPPNMMYAMQKYRKITGADFKEAKAKMQEYLTSKYGYCYKAHGGICI